QRARQPVDLIDDHDIDLGSCDVGKQRLQRRPVERRAGETAIVVMIWNEAPALMGLALYICLTRLSLGIERVELEIEIRFSRFSGVDGGGKVVLSGRLGGWPYHGQDSVSRC